MIRIADINDMDQIIDLTKIAFNDIECNYDEQNIETYKNIFKACLEYGVVIVSENNGKINGWLWGLKTPNLLCPQDIHLQVITIWVKPEKRGSSIFYRINSLLNKEIKKHTEVKFINYTKGKFSNVDYTKLGFRKFEETYIKEI